MTHEEVFSYNKHIPKLPLDKPFTFGVIGLAHGHIYGMCSGLISAGATMKCVCELNDPSLLTGFLNKYPGTPVVETYEEMLADPEIDLIVSADIPSHRAPITVKAMLAGKDVFVDKAPLISLEQLAEVKETAKKTGKKLFVCYSEFVSNEAAVFAKQLIDRGVIGEVCHIDIFAPHRLNAPSRPDWFWRREDTSGILTDIGSHQFQQFLAYAGTDNAKVDVARVGNYFNKEYPDFDDFGDAMLTADNGVTGYVRIDWLSPSGIKTWGDGKVVILGRLGYIELRKNCNIGSAPVTNTVYVCTDDGVFTESVSGKVGLPFFSAIINDCRDRTETAMTEAQTFNAIELAITAQNMGLNK